MADIFVTLTNKPMSFLSSSLVCVEAFVEEFVKEHFPGYKCQPLSELGTVAVFYYVAEIRFFSQFHQLLFTVT